MIKRLMNELRDLLDDFINRPHYDYTMSTVMLSGMI